MMTKESIRSKARASRLDLTNQEVEAASQKIIKKLIEHVDWTNIKTLHSYIPIPSLKEINTWPLLTYAWQLPNITTAIATARKSGKYMAVKVGPATKWRGLYPASRIQMPKDQKYDVIIVPTLAFDKDGWRLGWGGGFYDRFLADHPEALTIGLAYQASFIESGLPHEPHDIRLDKVITEV